MLRISKRREVSSITVKDLRVLLGFFPDDADVSICGMNSGFIHVDADDDGKVNAICIDSDRLDEHYEELECGPVPTEPSVYENAYGPDFNRDQLESDVLWEPDFSRAFSD